MDNKTYIAYTRVSTKRQGESGLGLEAQEAMINHYYGGKILHTFCDVKSGKNIHQRPELQKAIALCEKEGHVLVVAKLDRLSRNTEDCLSIWSRLKGKIRFCDIPGEPDKFSITMYVAFSERERDLISIRTKAALTAKAMRGWKPTHERFKVGALKIGGQSRWEDKKEYDAAVAQLLREFSSQKLSLVAMADRLNQAGVETLNGKKWYPMTVIRALQGV
jgi:DNA invertase Pin-like site-specific DNA recombinase